MLDKKLLMEKLSSNSSLKPIIKSTRISQMKLSMAIYNDRSIRDIKKMMKEANQVIRKSKEPVNGKRLLTYQGQNKGRYDDNELKQLTYQFQSVEEKYLSDQFPKGLRQSDVQDKNNFKLKRNLMKGKLGVATRHRKPTIMQYHSALPQNLPRMRSITLISENQRHTLEPKSPLRIKKRQANLESPKEVKIVLKRQQIMQAIDNLIQLVGTEESKDYFIPKEIIFALIEQKYFPQIGKDENLEQAISQTLCNPCDCSQKLKKYKVEVPYCDFVNLRDCKKSIDRIFNMPIKAAQRLAFKIYDRNGNGIIDQKDIMELFDLSDQFQAMEEDIQVIIKNYQVKGQDQSLLVDKGFYQNGYPSPLSALKFRKDSDYSSFSLEKLAKLSNVSSQVKTPHQSQNKGNNFQKSKYFTFRESKEDFASSKKGDDAPHLIELTWQKFQAAFGGKRPKIYFSLLDYLFNLNSQQIYEKCSQSLNDFAKNMKNFMVFNNSDGKSEIGQGQGLSEQKRKKTSISKDSSIKKGSFQGKNFSSIQNSINIIDMIGKVKSINYLQTLPYQ